MKKKIFLKSIILILIILSLTGCDFFTPLSATSKSNKKVTSKSSHTSSLNGSIVPSSKTIKEDSTLSDWIKLLNTNYTVDFTFNNTKETTKNGDIMVKSEEYKSTSYIVNNTLLRYNYNEYAGYIEKDKNIYYLVSENTYKNGMVYYPYSVCITTSIDYFTKVLVNENKFSKLSSDVYYLNFNNQKLTTYSNIIPLLQALSLSGVDKGEESKEEKYLKNSIDGAYITDINTTSTISDFYIKRNGNDIIFEISISHNAKNAVTAEKDKGIITLRFYNMGSTIVPSDVHILNEYNPSSWDEAPLFSSSSIEYVTDPIKVPFIYPTPINGNAGYNSIRTEYINTGESSMFNEESTYVLILDNTYLKDEDVIPFKTLVESKLEENGFLYIESTTYNLKEVKWYFNKDTRCRIGYSYLTLIIANDAPINRLSTPVVSINKETGVASWIKIKGATGYSILINNEEKTQNELSITLSLNDEILVKALGCEPYTSDSEYSILKKYSNDPFVYSKDEIEMYHSNSHVNLLINEENRDNILDFYNSFDDIIYEFFSTYTISLNTLTVDDEDLYIFGKFVYSDYSLTKEEAVMIYQMYKADHPLYYFLDTTYIIGEQGSDHYIAPVCSADYIDGEVRKELNDNIIESLRNIVSNLESYNDYLKIRMTYKEICDAMSYAYKDDGVTPENEIWAHNIIGFFNKGKGVCESYARTLSLILNAVGIDNYYVTGVSSGENHAWNLVKLDDNWYWCDNTWDDHKILIMYNWNYFLVNDETIYKDHTLDVIYNNLPLRAEYNYSILK